MPPSPCGAPPMQSTSQFLPYAHSRCACAYVEPRRGARRSHAHQAGRERAHDQCSQGVAFWRPGRARRRARSCVRGGRGGRA
eukprot:2903599-Pyramimonas_sp.AAC.1